VDEVIQYFQKGEDYPEVDGKNVALAGEKLGANVGVYAAKSMTDSVKAIILISPGLEYKGLDASRGLMDYPNNTLIVTSKDAKDSFTDAKHLYNWITGPKTLQIYEKIGEGTDMINQQPKVQQYILDWLTNAVPPIAGAPSVSGVDVDKLPDPTAPTDPNAVEGKEAKAPTAEKPSEKP
jgi:hypothetical protein